MSLIQWGYVRNSGVYTQQWGYVCNSGGMSATVGVCRQQLGYVDNSGGMSTTACSRHGLTQAMT